MISIIIPSYNGEKYIRRCLDSILKQTYKDFELIIVDDGSTDNSSDIFNEYAEKDDRIVYIRQEKQGTSEARNKGLEMAKSNHITFVDIDDSIEPDYLQTLYNHKESDLVVIGFDYIRDGEIRHMVPEEENISFENHENIKRAIADRRYMRMVWAKLFKKDIITKNNLLFDSRFKFSQDSFFLFHYITYCQNAQLVNYMGYNYFAPNSLMKKYNMEVSRIVTLLGAMVGFLEEVENKYAIDLSSSKERYEHVYCQILLRKEAHARTLKGFVADIREFRKAFPKASAYPSRRVFRYLESEFILRCPTVGYLIRGIFK